MEPNLLQYVEDPLHPGTFIPENDPRYSAVVAWMSAQKQDSILRANAIGVFNRGMANWQEQASQADSYRLPRPALPTIPVVEVDSLVAAGDGSYHINTTFQPVASYPNPLLPSTPVSQPVDFGPNSPARPVTASDPVAVLMAQVAALTALIQQMLEQAKA